MIIPLIIVLMALSALGTYLIVANKLSFLSGSTGPAKPIEVASSSASVESGLQEVSILKENNVALKQSPSPSPSATPKPVIKESAAPVSSSSLKLTVEGRSGGAMMKWTGDSSNGFKACFAERENPSYPADTCIYKNASDRAHEIGGLTGGKTYHFRVGVYGTDGKVSVYSNDVTATPQGGDDHSSGSSNTSLSLSATSDEPGKVKLNWTLNGEPINGFKEVWADHENPTYPEDHWNYNDSNNLRSYTWNELPSGQTLHFRVGVYKSGQGVTTYSNDVTVTVK